MWKRCALVLVAGLVLCGAAAPAGCNRLPLVQKVTAQQSKDQRSLQLSVTFNFTSPSPFASLQGLLHYGYVFVGALAGEKTFQLGFDLQPEITNDPGYWQEPTTEYLLTQPELLKNGLGASLVRLQKPRQPGAAVDVVTFVDTLEGRWLGALALFDRDLAGIAPDGFAPESLSLQRTSDDRTILMVRSFDARASHPGVMGGVAVFVDQVELVRQNRLEAGKPLVLPISPQPLP